MSREIKSYIDDVIKNLVTKSDIDSLKSFIKEQSALLKNLTEKITTLDEKLNPSEASIENLSDKINFGRKIWKENWHTSSPKTS